MGSSWIDVAPVIVKTALACQPKSVVDIGMGAGKYGFLLREQTDFAEYRTARATWALQIDGVEGYAGTICDHQRAVYNEIFIEEALAFVRRNQQPYDVALVIDIIEHFLPDDGVELVRETLRFADTVIVSTPRGYFAQDQHPNPLEHHRSWWPTAALVELARRCGVHVGTLHVWMATVAVFSKRGSPKLDDTRLRSVLRFARDAIVPERLYYKLRGAVGPSILTSLK